MNLLSNIKFIISVFRRKVSTHGKKTMAIGTLILALCILISCSDDLSIHVDNEVEGDTFTGITLYIPDIENAAEYGATRSDEYANTRAYDQAKEGSFNTLYVVAINSEGKANVFLRNQSEGIIDDPRQGEEQTIYQRYKISLSPGEYKFYVVSNMNRYLLDENGNHISFYDYVHNKENAEYLIKKIILNFNSSTPLEPGFLPMACLHQNIRVGSSAANATTTSNKNGNSPDGTVTIPKDEPKIVYADLDFLCSKVRYSIIFDREKAKETGFTDDDVIDINRNVHDYPPYVTQIRKQTGLTLKDPEGFILNSSNDPDQWSLYLDRYINRSNFDFYQSNPNNGEVVAALDEIEKNPWTSASGNWTTDFKDNRAWQGVTYLPENFVTSDPSPSDMTLLEFPYRFNGAEADKPKEMILDFVNKKDQSTVMGYGLKRGMQYDIYAIIQTPDESKWTLNVIPRQWSLESLAFQLHGPYELIVETTEIEKLSMEESATMWFWTDVSPDEVKFVSPQVSINNNPDDASSMRDIYIGEFIKDDKGNFLKNEQGYYQLKVSLNPNIPFSIMDQFNNEEGNEFGEVTYTKSDINFFHLVVGSLHKRISIKELGLDPYLNVEPQTIVVDVRELYMSADDPFSYPIHFVTNVDVDTETDLNKVSLTFSDPDELYTLGKGDGSLYVSFRDGSSKIQKKDGTIYLKEKEGYFDLNVQKILEGNTYWNQNNEYTLTFTLTVNRNGKDPVVIKRKVTIKIHPFTGVYVIHFRDNTKDWENAHIYIFQDLTLPNNMQEKDERDNLTPYEHAGKVVGYVEPNPNLGFQWNAAVQYVFTNNLAFRGWGGKSIRKYNNTFEGNDYGGPEINNPWAEATCNYFYPDPNDDPTQVEPKSTMGFVIFGKPVQRDDNANEYHYERRWFWNYDYSYTHVYGLEMNPNREEHYNYDVNFNYDHEQVIGRWKCQNCVNNSPDYNLSGTDTYFYPGISMEREEDGWWKYTLTGVASPGRTMIIFANWHAPWDRDPRDYQAEDWRYPGDYEAGLPLFDFEDNEGWFLFDGNTTNDKQKFSDNKPDGVIPHDFGAQHSNLKIYIDKPSTLHIDHFELGYQRKYNGSDGRYDESQYDADSQWLGRDNNLIVYNDRYHKYSDISVSQLKTEGTQQYLPVTLPPAAYGYEYLVLKIFTSTTESKTYMLPTKFFVQGDGGYKTVHPLYLQFKEGIKLFVKWTDVINLEQNNYNGDEYSYYSYGNGRPKNGCDYLGIFAGTDNSNQKLRVDKYTKLYGNFKSVKVTLPPTTASQLSLRLCIDENGTGVKVTNNGSGYFHQNLKVEDLPQYYNPAEDYYQINWHMFKKPND